MPNPRGGDTIKYFGDYVLFGEIGHGAMGTVQRARQRSTRRTVALKLIRHLANEAGSVRLRTEAEAVARLEHPNIVQIYEIGEHEGQPYIAMQLVEGESLAERITRLGEGLKESDAALLMVKVALAVHHAHERGVLHRDLKPGNILIDENGEPHLIDFGLAKCLEHDSGLTQTGAFLGTPSYASPEQAAGQTKSITIASDIYSLGAILYALLTGQPPFCGESPAETLQKVQNSSPVPPRTVRPAVSRDLEIIGLKCLAKEPGRRYASALELAQDLQRSQDGRPITARPVGAFERLWMWARRNPVHAALGTTIFLAIVASVVGVFLWRDARAKETAARTRLLATQAEERSQILRRQVSLEQTQVIRLTAHSAGWSDKAWSKVGEAAKIPTSEVNGDLRDQAAALLAGLDARPIKQFTNFGASSVSFDQAGKRLLMGGITDSAKLWDLATDIIHTNSGTNLGPVAFAENGDPLQLLYDSDHHSLALANVLTAQTVREWEIPLQMTYQSGDDEDHTTPALTRDGLSIAAVFAGPDGQAMLAASQSNTFLPLASYSTAVTAVAISPSGSLVAAGDSTGHVSVWSVRDRRRVAEFTASRNKIRSLALKQTIRSSESRAGGTNGVWLLAVGDDGVLVTIWDVDNRTSTPCRGRDSNIYAVAFSPDGTTLTSGGRGPVEIWDVATGRLLLDVSTGDYISGLDFAADGTRLAVSTLGHTYPPNVSVWKLEFGRGIQTFRGLAAQVSRVCFSADGSRLAALSDDWEVGVWDLNSGQLLRIIEAPRGEFADNAPLAFSPDGRHIAFSTLVSAKLWDIQTGAELRSWDLPPGLVDVLAFPDRDHLLLFREETKDKTSGPFGGVDRTKHPCVCRIRDLLSHDPLTPLAEIPDFNWRVHTAVAPRDGECFVVEGLGGRSGDHRMIKAFTGRTGKELWALDSNRTANSSTLVVDPAGQSVALQTEDTYSAKLVELTTGATLDQLPFPPSAFVWQPRLYVQSGISPIHDQGFSFLVQTNAMPLVTLGIDGAAPTALSFDPTARRVAWGNTDGSVSVCDLKQIRDALSGVGLQW
jgi:eukaryotic-like serine/threonine-protein kinase